MSELKGFFAKRRKRLSRLILWPLGLAIILTNSGWHTHVVFAGFLFSLGCVLVAVASVGRLWCSQYICGYKTTHLITSGPYSLCRNPLYFFSSLGAIGVGLSTQTLTIPLVLVFMFAISYPTVIRFEEEKMSERHGVAFKDYVARVPRFFPRLKGLNEPESYVVVPAVFRSALLDAVWFTWIVGLVALAAALRSAGVLPTIMTLY